MPVDVDVEPQSDYWKKIKLRPGSPTWSELSTVMTALLKGLGQVLKEEYAKRDVRLDALEILHRQLAEKSYGETTGAASGILLRLAALEQRPSFEDRGVWAETEDYKHLAGVSFDGGFWLAQRASRGEKPGVSSAWRLAVRRGKPGKDGQDLR